MVISSHQVLRGCVETDAVRSYQATSNIADLIIATPPPTHTHTSVCSRSMRSSMNIFAKCVWNKNTAAFSQTHHNRDREVTWGFQWWTAKRQRTAALRTCEFRAEQIVYKSACAAWPWIVLHINQLNSIITAQHLRDPEKKVATYNIQSILSSLPPPCETTCLQY